MQYIKGNILDITEGLVGHGCNLAGGYASGVAGAIARKYPIAKDEYKMHFSECSLGDVQYVQVTDALIIVNCMTQQSYGRDPSVVYADLEAINICLIKIANYCIHHEISSVHIPRIGAGLGNLDWFNIEKLIVAIEHDFNIEFIVHSL